MTFLNAKKKVLRLMWRTKGGRLTLDGHGCSDGSRVTGGVAMAVKGKEEIPQNLIKVIERVVRKGMGVFTAPGGVKAR